MASFGTVVNCTTLQLEIDREASDDPTPCGDSNAALWATADTPALRQLICPDVRWPPLNAGDVSEPSEGAEAAAPPMGNAPASHARHAQQRWPVAVTGPQHIRIDVEEPPYTAIKLAVGSVVPRASSVASRAHA